MASVGQPLEPHSELSLADAPDKTLEDIVSPIISPIKGKRMPLDEMADVICSAKLNMETPAGKKGGRDGSRQINQMPDSSLPKYLVSEGNNLGRVSSPSGYGGMIHPEVFRQEDFNVTSGGDA